MDAFKDMFIHKKNIFIGQNHVFHMRLDFYLPTHNTHTIDISRSHTHKYQHTGPIADTSYHIHTTKTAAAVKYFLAGKQE